MKLKLQERIHISALLPVQGTFETLVFVKSIKSKIEITTEEVEKFELKTIGNGLSWNNVGVESNEEFDFSEGEKKTIIDSLKKASASETLPIDLMDLYSSIAV